MPLLPRFVLAATAAWVLLFGGVATAQTAASALGPLDRIALERAYLGEGYQTELPGEDSLDDDWATGKLLQEFLERLELGTGALGAAGSVFRLLLWMALGVVAFLLLTWFWRRLQEGVGLGAPIADSQPARRRAQEAGARVLGSAEALAAEGRFQEAVHLLLLHALREMGQRLERVLPQSHTSREILRASARREELTGEAQQALGALVGAVERHHFGGEAAEEADWHRLSAAFRRFIDGLGGKA